MKRPPNPGELTLVHTTEDSGDVLSIAVSRDNFNPRILAGIKVMEKEPVLDYRLSVSRLKGSIIFSVWYQGHCLSVNYAERFGNRIELMTRLRPTPVTLDRPSDEIYRELADLEQCAALMLLEVEL